MSAGKFLEYYSCVDGNSGGQTDAEQAYVQAFLKGPETWVLILPEGIQTKDGLAGVLGHRLFAFERLYMGTLIAEADGKNTAMRVCQRPESSL